MRRSAVFGRAAAAFVLALLAAAGPEPAVAQRAKDGVATRLAGALVAPLPASDADVRSDPRLAARWQRRVAAAGADGDAARPRHPSAKAARPFGRDGVVQDGGDCRPAVLAEGASVGRLADGDCRWGQLTGLSDASFVDVYALALTDRSRVRLSASSDVFDTLVQLRDARYAQVASITADAGDAAEIDVVVPAGAYVVLVTSAAEGVVAGGDYGMTLAVGVEDAPVNCTTQPLALGATVDGNLGASGCRGYDHFERRWWTGDAAVYAVALPSAGTLSLEVTAGGPAAAPPRLAVFTRTGLTLIESTFGAADPVAAATLDVALPAGTFHVLVYADATDQAGAFRLRAAFADATAACRAADAALGVELAATLDADCRLAHLGNGTYFDNAMDLVALTVPQDGVLTFSLEATGFAPLLFLYDERNRPLVDGPFGDGFRATMSPGRYHLAVATESRAVGAYRLQLDFAPDGRPCTVQAAAWGTPIDGSIDATDCAFSEFNAILPYGQGVDVYVVDVPARGNLDIGLTSSAIDPFLALFGGPLVEGNELVYFLASHDDIDLLRDTNARLQVPVWPGRYLLAALSATTEGGQGAGAYRLDPRFTPAAAPDCAVTGLEPDAQVSADLDGTECRAFDRDPARYTISPQDRYRVDVPYAGVLSIHMRAPSFSPRLQLSIGAFADPFATDYDPQLLGNDARLTFVAQPGTYWIDAEEAGGARTATGAYTLQTTFEPRPRCTAITALDSLPARRDGTIGDEDCLLGDPPLAAQLTAPVDYYRFTVHEVGSLRVRMTSTAIDPALYLIDARWSILAAHANIDGQNTDSELALDAIAPGTYVVAAISTDPEGRGAYTLDVSFAPAAFEAPTPGGPTATPRPPEATPTPGGAARQAIYLPLVQRLYLTRR